MIDIIKQTRSSILVIIFSILTWAVMMPKLPNYIGMQYTMDGEVIWETNKYLAATIIIGIMITIYILAIIKPLIDPEKNSYVLFRKYFSASILMTEILVYLVSCGLMLNAMDIAIDLSLITMLSVGFLLIIVGNYLPKIPTTWFVGVRNPWSLSDRDVWNKTHRFTAVLYIFVGFLFILGTLLSLINVSIILLVVAVCVITPHIYSYLIFKSSINDF